jgi:hypothetical protein
VSARTGKWDYIVTVGDLADAYRDGELTFEETRDGFVERLRASGIKDRDFEHIVNDLETSPDMDEADFALDDLYDWGDFDKRLWFQTF